VRARALALASSAAIHPTASISSIKALSSQLCTITHRRPLALTLRGAAAAAIRSPTPTPLAAGARRARRSDRELPPRERRRGGRRRADGGAHAAAPAARRRGRQCRPRALRRPPLALR
jgi:hypothetical protein